MSTFTRMDESTAEEWATIGVETAKTFCYRVLGEANAMDLHEGGRGEIHKLTAAAILYAAETCTKLCSDAVQIFAFNGQIAEMCKNVSANLG